MAKSHAHSLGTNFNYILNPEVLYTIPAVHMKTELEKLCGKYIGAKEGITVNLKGQMQAQNPR